MEVSNSLPEKAATLRQIIADLGSVGVAFSGGVDSTFLLATSLQVLGRKQVLALTVASALVPAAEMERAEQLAGQLDARHRLIRLDVLSNPGVQANPPERCYHCKRAIFTRLLGIAQAEGLGALVHGANVDDLGDYRPGMRAADEVGARAPLLEAGLSKSDVRALSRQMGLSTWDQPSMACLASRVPYGTPLTLDTLARIEAAEDLVRDCTRVQELRVRDHFPVARIEVPRADIVGLAGPGVREQIVSGLKALGYRYITLDLDGLRSGSMNEAISGRELN